jgi:hypothetical protein
MPLPPTSVSPNARGDWYYIPVMKAGSDRVPLRCKYLHERSAEKISSHLLYDNAITALFVFLPSGSKNIFPPFEKEPKQGYFCLNIFHLLF